MSETPSNSPSPIPPPSTEELARRLKANLAKDRPRRTRMTLIALALVVAGLSGLAWFLRPQPAPGRWTIVAFDDWALAGQPAICRARIEPLSADEPPGSPRGQEIFFRGADQPQAEFVKKLADEHGEAAIEATAKESGFTVLYLGPQRKYKAEDRGRHFHFEPHTRLLVVEVEETVAELPPEGWGTRNPQTVLPKKAAAEALTSLAKHGYQVVYLSRNVSTAKDYQRVRSWAELHKADGLPDGPVLAHLPGAKDSPNDSAQRLLSDLRKRWPGPLFLVVGSEASAAAGKTAGITTYVLGDVPVPPGTIGAKTWQGARNELVQDR